jgi:hypothetical protein
MNDLLPNHKIEGIKDYQSAAWLSIFSKLNSFIVIMIV